MRHSRLLATGVATASFLVCTAGPVAAAAPADSRPVDGPQRSGFSATVTLESPGGRTPVDVDFPRSVGEILKAGGHRSADWRTEDNRPVDPDERVADGSTVRLFQSEVSSSSETVTLPAPQVTKETDELYLGESKVESEGKDGTAIKTMVSVKDTAPAGEDSQAATETLTVVEAPQPKVTLVGTRQWPAPTPPPATQAPAADAASPVGTPQKAAASQEAPSVTTEGSADGVAAAQVAAAQVGKAYVWGATGPNAFDCSGLVVYAYRGLGYRMPRTADAIGRWGTQVPASDIQVGDVLYTDTHIAIYVGAGKVVHAANPSRGVVTENLSYFLGAGYKVARLAR